MRHPLRAWANRFFNGTLGGILGGVFSTLIFGLYSLSRDGFRLQSFLYTIISDQFRLEFFLRVIVGAISGAIAGDLQVPKFWLTVWTGFVVGLVCASVLIQPGLITHVRE